MTVKDRAPNTPSDVSPPSALSPLRRNRSSIPSLLALLAAGLMIVACARGAVPDGSSDPAGADAPAAVDATAVAEAPSDGQGGPTAGSEADAAPQDAAAGTTSSAGTTSGAGGTAAPSANLDGQAVPGAAGGTGDGGTGDGGGPNAEPNAESAPANVAPTAAPADIVDPGAGSREDPIAHPLSVARMRSVAYPGSDLVIEQTLVPGANYTRYVVSYTSEGNKIFAMLTVPTGERPPAGWPVIIFNHGYIPPAQYRTTERYVAYVDAFARNGYIVLKSDYRGHGSSEGVASGGRGTPDYTIDVLNGMASVARFAEADRSRMGMWGHSMGGSITLRAMVVTNTIKAGVIWAGVVASYPDMYNRLGSTSPASTPTGRGSTRGWRNDLVARFGPPDENPAAWDAVSPNAFLADIAGPLQLHHGTVDSSVPYVYSQRLQEQMEAAGKPSELLTYDGDDHNISKSLSVALQRSVEFFDRHVKGSG